MSVINAVLGQQKDFKLKSGNTWVYPFRVLQFDGVTPLDLSTADFSTSGVWKKGRDPDTELPDFPIDKGAGLTLSGANNEECDVAVLLTATSRHYIYRIRAIFPGGGLHADLIYGAHLFFDKES
jgi:hypothetical protein